METRPGWGGVGEHGARREPSFRRQKSSPLDGVKHPFSEQRKARPTIPLPFDQFELGHVSLDHAVIDPPGETSSHGVFVFLHPSRKRLEFRKGALFHLVKPGIKMLTCACTQHLRKLLNQVIGQINFGLILQGLTSVSCFLTRNVFWQRRNRKRACLLGRRGGGFDWGLGGGFLTTELVRSMKVVWTM